VRFRKDNAGVTVDRNPQTSGPGLDGAARGDGHMLSATTGRPSALHAGPGASGTTNSAGADRETMSAKRERGRATEVRGRQRRAGQLCAEAGQLRGPPAVAHRANHWRRVGDARVALGRGREPGTRGRGHVVSVVR